MGNSSEYWVINRRGNGCFGERRAASQLQNSRTAELQIPECENSLVRRKGCFINNRKTSDGRPQNLLSSCFLDFRHLTSDSLITHLLLQLLCYRHHHTIIIFTEFLKNITIKTSISKFTVSHDNSNKKLHSI